MASAASSSKEEPYVAKFTGKKIRTFKFNYSRIFGLKESGFVTIDPGTFEVTNTFDYADITNLKMGKDELRFEFKSKQHGTMEFESTFRRATRATQTRTPRPPCRTPLTRPGTSSTLSASWTAATGPSMSFTLPAVPLRLTP